MGCRIIHYQVLVETMSYISVIDIRKKIKAIQSGYYNEAITAVNGQVIRVKVMTGGYPWNLHLNSDETFIVMEDALMQEELSSG